MRKSKTSNLNTPPQNEKFSQPFPSHVHSSDWSTPPSLVQWIQSNSPPSPLSKKKKKVMYQNIPHKLQQ